MGGFDPWNGLVLLLLVAIPAAVILAMVWLFRRNRHARHHRIDHARVPMHDTRARPAAISHAVD